VWSNASPENIAWLIPGLVISSLDLPYSLLRSWPGESSLSFSLFRVCLIIGTESQHKTRAWDAALRTEQTFIYRGLMGKNAPFSDWKMWWLLIFTEPLFFLFLFQLSPPFFKNWNLRWVRTIASYSTLLFFFCFNYWFCNNIFLSFFFANLCYFSYIMVWIGFWVRFREASHHFQYGFYRKIEFALA
jgi:hypothetical protein